MMEGEGNMEEEKKEPIAKEARLFGYKKLIVWQNASKLRKIVYDMTEIFPKIELRRISQMRDAARSVKQNIQEGYNGGSLGKYIQGLNISKGSLGELMGDIDDSYEDNLINLERYDFLVDLSKKTDYLLFKLIKSLENMRFQGTWKSYKSPKKLPHNPSHSLTIPQHP